MSKRYLKVGDFVHTDDNQFFIVDRLTKKNAWVGFEYHGTWIQVRMTRGGMWNGSEYLFRKNMDSLFLTWSDAIRAKFERIGLPYDESDVKSYRQDWQRHLDERNFVCGI